MTTEINLPALIAELEAATEGSPALDRQIMLFEGWIQNHPDEPASMWRAAKGRTYVLAGHVGVRAVSGTYPYTRSIDAALSLLPGYHKWVIGAEYAAVWHEDGRLSDATHVGATSKPALALCTACLKARLHTPPLSAA